MYIIIIIIIIIIHSAYGVTIYGSGWRKVVVTRVTGVCPNWPNQIYLYLFEDSTG